jgi:hypothetical protein
VQAVPRRKGRGCRWPLVGCTSAILFTGGHISMSTRLLALLDSLRTQFGVVDPNSGRLCQPPEDC